MVPTKPCFGSRQVAVDYLSINLSLYVVSIYLSIIVLPAPFSLSLCFLRKLERKDEPIYLSTVQRSDEK